MKKIVFSLLGILLTTSSAFALIDHYKAIGAGQYTCPEENSQPCIINKYKTGEVHFGYDCLEDKTSKTSKYAPMIKRRECRVSPDPGEYYICEYADTKCSYIKYNGRNKISCKQKKKRELSKEQRKAMNNRIHQDVLAGNCRPMYPDEKTQDK
ncbi:hypothetical protein IKL64_03930 [bacterium]|nr:hypothetical protein [bacterium]